ncbi:hypothetical protein GF342_04065 [Candidatus Woesearchaeota archaeon]|nr:hypothetical protein [Candidatus Woesearchaeota archaeon]
MITSISSDETSICFGLKKTQAVISSLRSFFTALGHTYAEREFMFCDEKDELHDENVKDLVDDTRQWEFDACKVRIFWGLHNVFVCLFFDPQDRDRLVTLFERNFSVKQ